MTCAKTPLGSSMKRDVAMVKVLFLIVDAGFAVGRSDDGPVSIERAIMHRWSYEWL